MPQQFAHDYIFYRSYKQPFTRRLLIFLPLYVRVVQLVLPKGMQTFTPTCAAVFPSFMTMRIITARHLCPKGSGGNTSVRVLMNELPNSYDWLNLRSAPGLATFPPAKRTPGKSPSFIITANCTCDQVAKSTSSQCFHAGSWMVGKH